MKKSTFLLLLTFIFSGAVKAQLTGVKTIGGVTPDYATIAAAVTDLNAQGVSGPVTFNIRNGTYTESGTITINNITGASAVNTIIFQSENSDSTLVTWTSTSSSVTGVVRLNGASYITFRKISIKATVGGGDYSLSINITGTGTDNHIENCIITGRPTTTNFADPYGDLIYSSASNNLFIKNNVFTLGQKPIYIGGGSGVIVDGNIFNTNTDYSVYFAAGTAPIVSNNMMNGKGIHLSASGASQIFKNKITGLSGGYGININKSNAASGSHALVANNFIQIGGASAAYGIYDSVSTYFDIYHNSINISSTSAAGFGIHVTGGTGNTNNIVNNIFFNSGNGFAYSVATPAAVGTSDYNDIHSYGTSVARWNSVNQAALSNLQAAGGMDVNSKSANPSFASATDLHAGSAAVNNAGTPLTAVTDDIDWQVRNGSTPDIGADEFTPPAIDAAVYSNAIITPVVPFAAGSQSVTIALSNNGSTAITSATINWYVNSVPQTPFSFNGNISGGATSNITVGNYNFISGKEYIISARVSNPNGSGNDADITNDSSAFSNRGPMLCGNFTVYGASPDYINLTTAATALQNWGVSCAVSLNLRTGVYNNQARISIGPVYGTSAANTVTITSETGNAADVTYSASNSASGIFELKGADHFIIRDLTWTSLSFTELIISVISGGNHFEALDNVFNAYTSGNSLQYSATVYSSADTNIIKGNTFNTGLYGIFLANNAHPAFWKVQCNRFNNNANTSMVITSSSSDSIIINSNIINNATGSGITMSGVDDGYYILKNRIYGSNGGTGIYIQNCAVPNTERGLVANNFIQTGSGSATAYGIYINNSTNTDIFYNNINVTSTNVSNGRALYVTGGTGNTNNLVNNIFANTGGGYAYYVSTPAAISNSSYNDLYSSGPSFASWGGTDYANLAALQAASGKNANSLSIDPVYTSSLDLHVGAPALQSAGTFLFDVTEDYDDQPRPAPPTIGADEIPTPFTVPDPSCFINIPTAVNTPAKNDADALLIYPNPVKDLLAVYGIEFTAGSVSMEIDNILGEKVYDSKLKAVSKKEETVVDVSAFPAGIYFIKVDNGRGKMVGKFIKE